MSNTTVSPGVVPPGLEQYRADAALGRAWRECEAALPEGHHLCAIERHCHVGDTAPGDWDAYSHDGDRWDGAMGSGSTPTAALRALREKLEARRAG